MATTIINLDTRRMDIIRAAMETDNIEVLDKVSRLLHRATKKPKTAVEDLTPYTMEEIDRWMDEAEAEMGGTPSQEVFDKLEQKHPFLCNYK